MNIEKRFLDKVNKNGPNIIGTKCWAWTASVNNKGYGKFGIDYKVKVASRVSYCLFKGEIPEGICVLHRCDNPLCVNPDHLFLGTQLDNIKDMHDKKRRRCGIGERQGKARLTEKQVIDIRRSFSIGEKTRSELAKQYGVAYGTIFAIIANTAWRHLL